MDKPGELTVTTTAITTIIPTPISTSITTASSPSAALSKPDKQAGSGSDEESALPAGDVPIVAFSESQLVSLLQKRFDASLDGNGHVPRFREVFNQTLFSRKRVATDKTDLHSATFCARFKDGNKADICPPTPAGYTCNCEICRVTTRLLLHFSGLSGSKHKLTRVGGNLREQALWSNGSLNSLGVKGSYSRHASLVANGLTSATKQQRLNTTQTPEPGGIASLSPSETSLKRPRLSLEPSPQAPPPQPPEGECQKQAMISRLPPSALITVTRTMPEERAYAAAAIRVKIHEFSDAELAKLIDTDGVSLETLVLASAEQDRRHAEEGRDPRDKATLGALSLSTGALSAGVAALAAGRELVGVASPGGGGAAM